MDPNYEIRDDRNPSVSDDEPQRDRSSDPAVCDVAHDDTIDSDAGTEPGTPPALDGADESDQSSLISRCLDGRFLIRDFIGHGAYGQVYTATQIALDRTVAIKVLDRGASCQETLAELFRSEAYAVSRLFHPNIVATYDHGRTDDGLLYIAMEYISGATLSTVIAERGPLELDRVVALGAQMLAALEEAHAASVVHADLKCENIMIHPLATGAELLKVIDFGIARIVRESRDDVTLPTIAGTPQYMAPEVIMGKPPTMKSDLYSAAVVLYRMATGKHPFSGASSMEILMQHLQEPVPFPADRPVPGPLAQIIETATAKEPGDRFADATEFRQALEALSVNRCHDRRDDRSRSIAASAARGAAQARAISRPRKRRHSSDITTVVVSGDSETRREIERIRLFGEKSFEEGDPYGGIELLRQAVGMAIRRGRGAQALQCYIALADSLLRYAALEAAITELEEAAALLDSGSSAPRELWRLLMLLAQSYDKDGRIHDALRTARRALERAARVFSLEGQEQASLFLIHIGHPQEARTVKPPGTPPGPGRDP